MRLNLFAILIMSLILMNIHLHCSKKMSNKMKSRLHNSLRNRNRNHVYSRIVPVSVDNEESQEDDEENWDDVGSSPPFKHFSERMGSGELLTPAFDTIPNHQDISVVPNEIRANAELETVSLDDINMRDMIHMNKDNEKNSGEYYISYSHLIYSVPLIFLIFQ
jgi:hypothetical protein